MVKKIKVINLVQDENPKTEAEELNSIVEEMAVDENTVAIVEPTIVEPIEPVIMKKKKTKAKTEVVKVIPEKIIVNFDTNKVIEKPIEVPIEESIEVVKENKNIKITEMVECPDCNKKMTIKSLKYSHKQNCIAHKQTEPIEKKPKQNEKSIIEKPKHIELPINNRLNRMNERAKKIELLASQAF
jgi:hypothetical protein